MKSFSAAIISDSLPCESNILPAWTAAVGWGVGIVVGMAASYYQFTNNSMALAVAFISLELALQYTLVTARDPSANLQSCKCRIKSNYRYVGCHA